MATASQLEREVPAQSATSQRLRARLALEFERSARDGRTRLAATVQEPPLRVIRGFLLEDGAALVHLNNVSGGLLGGDALELGVRLGPGAQAQLTTTGATRLYRPRAGSPPATQTSEIVVGENALLEYVPDALIPYAGARFRQRTRIRVEAGAGFFWWEIVAPGREAGGEVFAYERLEFATEISIDGKLVAAEQARLEPQRLSLSHPARMGRSRYIATLFICRQGLDARFWASAEERLREIAATFSAEGGARWGVSTLVSDGLVVRALAPDAIAVIAGLRALWSAAKRMIYGRDAIWPRKVN